MQSAYNIKQQQISAFMFLKKRLSTDKCFFMTNKKGVGKATLKKRRNRENIKNI